MSQKYLLSWLSYLILICLTTPAISILGVFGFSYFPNEKIAFIFLLIYFALSNRKLINVNLMIVGLTVSLIFATLIAIRWLNGGIINITDFNMIYVFSAIILYLGYFRFEYQRIVKALPVLVFSQLLISLFQQIFMQLDMLSYASIFNNYPEQLNYTYPSTNLGLFRTSGLFNESSQYASFLVLFVIAYMEGVIKKTRFSTLVLFLSIIDIMINQSITAFLITIIYLMYKIAIVKEFKTLRFVLLFVATAVTLILFPEVVEKIYLTLLGEEESYPRLLYAYQRIDNVINSNVFTGNGLNWNEPTWDLISIYFSGYGLIGLTAVLCYIYYIVRGANTALALIFIIFIFSNGNILVSLNILLLSFVYANKKFSNLRITNNSQVYCKQI